VPRGYEALLPFLESDEQLRANFFPRLKVIQYAGAALPAHLWERLIYFIRYRERERKFRYD
jgi:feruloyl-CoA synthase